MVASSVRSSEVQLGHGVIKWRNFAGAPLSFSSPEQLFPHVSSMFISQKQHKHTSYTGMPAHESTCTGRF